jgi:ABC-type transporter Mla maintaining outer membrane lipid asymmetry ATPase subunit MlaF
VNSPILEIDGLVKSYGGLRPLRLRRLAVTSGERVALAGFDQTTAEVFVNLVTGATLAEKGTIRAFGRATSDVTESADWLASLDRFGIVSERVVLLDQCTAAQNIAMSLTLDIDPLTPEVEAAVGVLASEVGLESAALTRLMQGATVATRHRVRLARAIATNPSVLLVEHPVAGLAERDVAPFAADLERVARGRGVAVVVLAAAVEAARPFGSRVLTLNGGTGELEEAARRGLLRWILPS